MERPKIRKKEESYIEPLLYRDDGTGAHGEPTGYYTLHCERTLRVLPPPGTPDVFKPCGLLTLLRLLMFAKIDAAISFITFIDILKAGAIEPRLTHRF